MSGFAIYRSREERMGAGRVSDVETIDAEIVQLIHRVHRVATESEASERYAPVLRSMLDSLRALRREFGK
jgi:hypothetical protein